MNNNYKKNKPALLTWGAKVHTLNNAINNDNNNNIISSSNSSSSNSNSTNTNTNSNTNPSSTKFRIQHIPNLTSSDYASSILKRIQNEFQLLAQKRGYNVTSVTEMCCCEDGLDYLDCNTNETEKEDIIGLSFNGNNTNNNTRKKKKKKRGRKTRIMPNNVLGYNLSSGYQRGPNTSSSHRIHLRLRQPTNHTSFFDYHDIVGTMCHELAHCEIGPHNAKFYKLMDEIWEQYNVYIVKGLVVDKDGFPLCSSEAYTLGGSKNKNSQGAAVKAAQERRKKLQLGLGGTYVLGGGLSYIQEIKQKENDQKRNGFNIYGTASSSSATSNSVSSLKHLPPKEAARIAAEKRIEQRSRIDSKYCLPCDSIIEILNGSSSEEEEEDDDELERKNRTSNNSTNENKNQPNVIIDLVDDSDDDNDDGDSERINGLNTVTLQNVKNNESNNNKIIQQWHCPQCTYRNLSNTLSCDMCGNKKTNESSSSQSSSSWSCHKCTYDGNKPLGLACEICGTERSSKNNNGATSTKTAIQKMVRQDFIDDVKAKEKEKSEKEFNGFNIYGNDRRSTSTLDHLT